MHSERSLSRSSASGSRRALIAVALTFVCASLAWPAAAAAAFTPGEIDPTFGSGGKILTQFGQGAMPSSFFSGVAVQPDGKLVAVGSASDKNGQELTLLSRLGADGSPDPTFGSGGAETLQLGTDGSVAQAVAIQPDGRIVLTGDAVVGGVTELLVARLAPNGSLDPSFGNGGVVRAPIGAAPDEGRAVAVDQTGRIVVAGSATDSMGHDEVMVVRLNPDGSFDSTFGLFGTPGVFLRQVGGTGGTSDAYGLALQTSGEITIAGSSASGGQQEALVARLTPDGVLDRSFAGDGFVTQQFGGGAMPSSIALAVALQTDGKIVITGFATDSSGKEQLMVARLAPTGALDPTFGSAGAVATQLANGPAPFSAGDGVAIQPNGRIVIGGTLSGGVFAARLNIDGSFDAGFGSGGMTINAPAAGPTPGADVNAMALQGDGKIVLAGDATDSSGRGGVLLERLFGDLPPVPAFSNSPAAGAPGQRIRFDARASADDGTITSYRWNFGDGATATGISVTHAYALTGSYTVALTVTDDDSLTGSETRSLIVAIPPRLRHVSEHPRRWLRSRGTTFRFTLNERASVTFRFIGPGQGRRVGKRCVGLTKRNRHKARCALTNTLTFKGHAGKNKVFFNGRLSRHQRLRPGTYTVTIIATNTAGQLATKQLTFTIVG